MFRVTVKTREVAGALVYHLRLSTFRDGFWRVCGVMVLEADEWVTFSEIALQNSFEIEVMDEAVQLTPPKPEPMVENDVERQCLDALRWRSYRPERLHAGLFKSPDGKCWIKGHPKGTPDYVVTHAKYPAFYLEVKRPRATPTPEQEEKHDELRLFGLAVVWVDSYTALLAWLEQHQNDARERWRKELENA